ncbi:PRK06851 family protein [Heyndrickxia sporothermodurans]|uniref:PRK06851 family protein n=1 Tax=Heyndrickxia sporothermodurans TaxID=46224 RepID=UPI002E1C6483|nr:PRK06851 family protein [Heyndrickxia sporothermodurans]MED3698431.1 PRK06851 family protein [Heyndrickxia sporothermodurans]
MAGKVLNYYAGGNTGRGFYNLFDSNLKGLERLFILKGGPGTGKSSMMKRLTDEWGHKGYDLEIIHCSSDNGSIDGVVIPKLKFGIVDGTAPHIIEPTAPGAIEEYVNVGRAWDSEKLQQHKERIISLHHEVSNAFQLAYDTFAKGLEEHDQLEEIYFKEMDFAKANQLTNELIQQIFPEEKLSKQADVRHRFLGAATPEGAADFIPNITDGLQKRYFLKGRAGTGKSTFLKKIAAAAEERGFDTEIYHCGFDPNSIDMVVVRELSFAIFDSTDPHEYFPDRDGDEIVDLYLAAVTPGTDEKYSIEIDEAHKRYKDKMKEGTAYLAKAKTLHDELEKYYVEAMDFTIIDRIYEEINNEIIHLESKLSYD